MRALGLLVVLAALCACVPDSSVGITTLVYASPYSPNHPFSRADQAWIAWVQAQSGGRLRIKAFWSATLISSDESMTELRHGVSDIGLITPIYERAGEQLLRAQSGFYAGVRTIDQQVALYDCLQKTFPSIRQELEGLHVLAVQGGALPGILTRTRPLHALADLKGLRIRAPSELLEVLRDLGADAINMPMDQVYSQLAKGMLDGVVAPPDTLRALHFSEVAKFYWQIAIPRGAYPARAIGARRWQSLTQDQQALLTASRSAWEAAIAREITASVHSGTLFGTQDGVVFSPVSAAEQRAFNALYDRDEARVAAGLSRYGVDGSAVYRYARALAAGIESSGRCDCDTQQPAIQAPTASSEAEMHPPRGTDRSADEPVS